MSKNKPVVDHNAPWCCGERTTWVDLGKWMQYYYCKKCKKEVKSGSRRDDDEGYGYNSPVSSASIPASFAQLPPWPSPSPLQPGEGVVVGYNPCTTQPNQHFWRSFTDFVQGAICNCGNRVNPQTAQLLKGIP